MMKPLAVLLLATTLVACGDGPDQRTTAPNMDSTATPAPLNGTQVVHLKEGGRMEGMMRDGKREGSWISYRADGGLWSRSTYVNGLEEGVTEVFHPGGKLYYTGQYQAGVPVGEWVFFDLLGSEVKRVRYDSTGAVIR
ncbi:MAG TPA: hypothetical protein PKJ19_13890 [Flavobacteriales bacterium]|nr:hypothetical protein [Flavobacteriales bacterium]HNU55166.1 hypothetical protein [Flavobacteriales bacterium]